jgi:histidinol dehydrogenase
MPDFRILNANDPEFAAALKKLAGRGDTDLERVEPVVREILRDVRARGDLGLSSWVEKYEGRKSTEFLIRNYGGKAALESLAPELRSALELAADRIRSYHEAQAKQQKSFEYTSEGVTLASRVTPIRRVGIYAPGGKASYPSSVLMCAVPARVAGVEQVYLASPDTSIEVRAACYLAGVTALVDAGGAQAIAAMAYGTESIPACDKIVGPGNIYVAAAKRLVFGQVDIDSIAGPSEILVLADDSADPKVVAADLLSQAEHDEDAYPLLVTTSARVAQETAHEIKSQVEALSEFDGKVASEGPSPRSPFSGTASAWSSRVWKSSSKLPMSSPVNTSRYRWRAPRKWRPK